MATINTNSSWSLLETPETSTYENLLNRQWFLEEPQVGFIDHHLASTFELVVRVFLMTGISFLGLVANIINIIIFIRQGFKDSINISLLGLAIADLGSLLTLIWMGICYNPLVIHSGIPINVKQIQYLTAGWPHVYFARITCYITAYITLERCLCIALPHKVKSILTPFRTLIINISIFLVVLISVAPVYYATRFTFLFDEKTNRSMFSFIYVEDGRIIENISLSFTVFQLLSSVVIVGACTATLIHNLLQKSKWRKSMASVDESFTTRDKKVMKMVLSVAVIFIVCYLPTAVAITMMVCFPEYSVLGTQKDLFIVIFGFLFVLEAVNSSVNIVIYHRMSSKFRAELRGLFGNILCLKCRDLQEVETSQKCETNLYD